MPTIKDIHGAALKTVEADTLRDAVLSYAVLSGAVLGGADLSGADLRGAVLHDADLSGAHLSYAVLHDAALQGVQLNWQSHDLLAEILRQHAGQNMLLRQVAGLVLISPDWCWHDFLRLNHPQMEWALNVLAEYAHPEDDLPDPIRERLTA